MEFRRLYLNTLMISLAVSACTNRNSHFLENGNSNSQVYVKALYSEPLTFDPIKMNDTASLVLSNLIYNGLLKFTPYMDLAPSMAESWKTDASGKIITFKLRNAFFHNGDKVKASDVVASLSRAVSKESTVYKYYDCIEGAQEYYNGRAKTVKGLEAIDDKTIIIKLKYPFPPFLSVLAGGTAKILPQNLFAKKDFFKNPIGAGPFKFESIEKDNIKTDIVLSRFEKYYSPALLEKIILRSENENIAHEEAAKGVVHDLANFPMMGTEEVFKLGEKVDSPAAWTWIIGMNTRLAPFNNKDIRIAFKNSVNSEAFRKRFYPDAIPAYGYVPPGMPGYKDKAEIIPNEIKPSKQKIKILFPSELAYEKEMREFLEKDLKSHGWNVEFISSDWKRLMDGYNDKTLQGFVVAMNLDYPDTEFLVRNFESSNPDNFSGLKDKKIDSLIQKARVTQDRISRDKIYAEVTNLIDNATVTVNLFHPRSHYWVNKCVTGFEPNLLSDVYIDYTKVSLNGNCDLTHREAMR